MVKSNIANSSKWFLSQLLYVYFIISFNQYQPPLTKSEGEEESDLAAQLDIFKNNPELAAERVKKAIDIVGKWPEDIDNVQTENNDLIKNLQLAEEELKNIHNELIGTKNFVSKLQNENYSLKQQSSMLSSQVGLEFTN